MALVRMVIEFTAAPDDSTDGDWLAEVFLREQLGTPLAALDVNPDTVRVNSKILAIEVK